MIFFQNRFVIWSKEFITPKFAKRIVTKTQLFEKLCDNNRVDSFIEQILGDTEYRLEALDASDFLEFAWKFLR